MIKLLVFVMKMLFVLITIIYLIVLHHIFVVIQITFPMYICHTMKLMNPIVETFFISRAHTLLEIWVINLPLQRWFVWVSCHATIYHLKQPVVYHLSIAGHYEHALTWRIMGHCLQIQLSIWIVDPFLPVTRY